MIVTRVKLKSHNKLFFRTQSAEKILISTALLLLTYKNSSPFGELFFKIQIILLVLPEMPEGVRAMKVFLEALGALGAAAVPVEILAVLQKMMEALLSYP